MTIKFHPGVLSYLRTLRKHHDGCGSISEVDHLWMVNWLKDDDTSSALIDKAISQQILARVTERPTQ